MLCSHKAAGQQRRIEGICKDMTQNHQGYWIPLGILEAVSFNLVLCNTRGKSHFPFRVLNPGFLWMWQMMCWDEEMSQTVRDFREPVIEKTGQFQIWLMGFIKQKYQNNSGSGELNKSLVWKFLETKAVWGCHHRTFSQFNDLHYFVFFTFTIWQRN